LRETSSSPRKETQWGGGKRPCDTEEIEKEGDFTEGSTRPPQKKLASKKRGSAIEFWGESKSRGPKTAPFMAGQ